MKTDKELSQSEYDPFSDLEVESYLFTENRKIEDYFLEVWSFGTGISFEAYGRAYDFTIDNEDFRLKCIDYLKKKGVRVVNKNA